MNFRRTPFCALLALCILLMLTGKLAQAKEEPWRQVSPAEVAQKGPIVEKDADAEYQLFEVRLDDTDDTDLSMKYYVRLKIFTDRGREQFSKIDITGSPNSKIKDVAARVIKPDGTIVELAPTDIFERTIVKVGSAKIKARSFAVPGIEPGVIVEYKYKETFENASAARPLDFQKEIPVQVMTYAVRPNQHYLAVTYERHNVPDSISFSSEKDDYRSITMNNVAAFHEEPQMPPLREIRPWMALHYGLDSILSGEFYWGAKATGMEKEMKDVAKPNDDIKRLSAQLIGSATTPEEKVAKLYEYCHTQFHNVTYDTTMTADDKAKLKENKSASDTFKRQMGNAIDVEILFVSLLRAAGMEATIAWTGNRGQRFFNRSMANIYLTHPLGTAVKVGNEWRFYNPGARFVPFGMLIWYEEGMDAFIPTTEGAVFVKTPMSEPDRTREKRTAKFRLLEDGTLEGDVRIEYTGQFSLNRKDNNYDDSVTQQEQTLKDEIKERLSTSELTDIKIENANDPTNPFAYDFKIKVPGYAQKTGKRLFLQPSFFEHGTGAMFTANERKYDIYFHYPWSEEDDVTFELPAGYALDSADKPAPITPEQTSGICALNIGIAISADKKTLTYHRSFYFGAKGNVVFGKENYKAVKQLFDLVRTADDHTIVLRQQ